MHYAYNLHDYVKKHTCAMQINANESAQLLEEPRESSHVMKHYNKLILIYLAQSDMKSNISKILSVYLRY